MIPEGSVSREEVNILYAPDCGEPLRRKESKIDDTDI